MGDASLEPGEITVTSVRRPLTTLLTLALTGAVLAGVATPVQAAALPYTARVTPEPALTAANSIAGAGGHLFVADTNAVFVFGPAGNLETTIAGVFGAKGITASPDGTKVYVAESSAARIATIDVATLTKTAEVAVSDCPSSLAVTSTTVFYASGCSTSGEINHVDRATGTPNDLSAPDASGFYQAPSLKSDGSTLYGLDYFGALSAWPVSGAALGTPVTASTGITQTPDWAVGGGRVAVTNMNIYGYSLYDGATLAKITDLPAAAYPRTVGFTPSGAALVGGLQNANPFWMFNPETGQNTSKTGLAAVNENVWPAGGGIAYDSSGSVAYMIGREWTGDGAYHYSLIATTLGTPGTTSVSVAVTPAARYGAATTFTVTGTPNATAGVDVVSNGKKSHYNLPLGSTGHAVLKVTPRYSGTVTATVAGDLTHSGFTSAAPFRVPSRTTVALSKGHKKVNGIVYYAKASLAKQQVRVVNPVYGRAVTATLSRLQGRRWVKVQSVTIHTTATGYGYTQLTRASRGVSYRVRFTFKGDSFANRSSATSGVFRIG
jgi:YVTN family beta-propeller protein